MALSPQLEEHNLALLVEQKLDSMRLYSDPGNHVAQQFGVAMQLPEEVRAAQESVGLDLAAFNGDESGVLPLASRFIIDGSGIIRHASISTENKERPPAEELLATLRAMNQGS